MSQPEKILTITDSITVGELAEALNLPVTQLVGELFKNGIVATINQRIDFETAQIIVEELKIAVQLKRKEVNSAPVQHLHKPSAKASLRPPIVAVMGQLRDRKSVV